MKAFRKLILLIIYGLLFLITNSCDDDSVEMINCLEIHELYQEELAEAANDTSLVQAELVREFYLTTYPECFDIQ